MKLLLLLSDEAQIANRRDMELKQISHDKEEIKKKVAVLLDELLRPSVEGESSASNTQT